MVNMKSSIMTDSGVIVNVINQGHIMLIATVIASTELDFFVMRDVYVIINQGTSIQLAHHYQR